MKLIFSIFFVVSSMASTCSDLFNQRGEELSFTLNAISCYERLYEENQSDLDIAEKLSYLYFFKASYFEDDPMQSLKKSFSLAQKTILLFGPFYSYTRYQELENDVQEKIARFYYLYGTSVSLFVEYAGQREAIKRLKSIKSSMAAILKMKQKQVYHFGAYRTLAIVYFKVPAIAGGSDKKSKAYFKRLMKESVLENGKSNYLANHYFYAQYLWKYSQKDEACQELRKITSTSQEEIKKYYPDLIYESYKDIETAKKRMEKYKCL